MSWSMDLRWTKIAEGFCFEAALATHLLPFVVSILLQSVLRRCVLALAHLHRHPSLSLSVHFPSTRLVLSSSSRRELLTLVEARGRSESSILQRERSEYLHDPCLLTRSARDPHLRTRALTALKGKQHQRQPRA